MKRMKVLRCFICVNDIHLEDQYRTSVIQMQDVALGHMDIFVIKNGQINQVWERNLQLFLRKSSKAHKWTNVFWMTICWTKQNKVELWTIKVEHLRTFFKKTSERLGKKTPKLWLKMSWLSGLVDYINVRNSAPTRAVLWQRTAPRRGME